MQRLAIVLVLMSACSSKKDEPTPTPTTPSGSAPAAPVDSPPAPPPVDAAVAGSGSGSDAVVATGDLDFKKLSHKEQMDFMKKNVVPAMKKEFQAFDAKEFQVFNCKTCHGKDPEKSKFKMPSPDLPKLDFEALEAGKDKKVQKVADWMAKVVKPQMAKILNVPEYSESNPKGFGCLHCHEQKKK